MTHLQSSNPNLALHLSDRLLTPLISSARTPLNTTNIDLSPETQSQSQRQCQSNSLASLTTTALTVYDSTLRLGLGLPQRVMIETAKGPLVLHSFLNTKSNLDYEVGEEGGGANGDIASTAQGMVEINLLRRPLEHDYSGQRGRRDISEDPTNGIGHSVYHNHDEGEAIEMEIESKKRRAPLLISTVIAGRAEELGDATRAAGRLEKLGREFQSVWMDEEEAGDEKGVERRNG